MAIKFAELLQRLGHTSNLQEKLTEDLRVLPLLDTVPISADSLRDRKVHRAPPEPRILRERRLDPAVMARQRDIREYLSRRRVSAEGIAAYLEEQMGDFENLEGSEMQIKTVEDFIAFVHLRHLPYLSGMQKLQRKYRIERRQGWIDNQRLRCPGFIVHRNRTGTRDVALPATTQRAARGRGSR